MNNFRHFKKYQTPFYSFIDIYLKNTLFDEKFGQDNNRGDK